MSKFPGITRGFFGKNVALGSAIQISPWRKVAIATWDAPTQSSVYGLMEVCIDASLQWIEKMRLSSGKKITLTHVIAKAIAETAARCPELNCLLRWGRLYPRKEIRLFFQVASDTRGDDLSGIAMTNAHHLTLTEIADEMNRSTENIRKNGDMNFSRMKKIFNYLPAGLSYYLIRITSFLMYTLNLWCRILGIPQDAFGSIMVTNVGSLGLDGGFAPLVPYSRAGFLFAIGKTKDELYLDKGQLATRKILPLFITYDHRYLDGVQGARIITTLRQILENPERELVLRSD